MWRERDSHKQRMALDFSHENHGHDHQQPNLTATRSAASKPSTPPRGPADSTRLPRSTRLRKQQLIEVCRKEFKRSKEAYLMQLRTYYCKPLS